MPDRVQATGSELDAERLTDMPAEIRHPDSDSRGNETGTVLAFDFGTKRIGVAVGEIALRIAHPLTTIHASARSDRYASIAILINEWRPSLLVVGLPAHMDGAEHEMSRLSRKFAHDLSARFSLPVEFVDERLTSAAADSSLAEAGIASRKRRPLLDLVAAQHVLQAYLDTVALPS